MVKSIVSIIVSVAILLGAALYEHWFLSKTFNELNNMLDVVYEKLEDKQAVEDDILAVQKLWLNKKRALHIYIPHTEIKEIDLWIAECVTYTKYDKFEDAQAKVEVVRELCEQIPKTFLMRLENLF